MSLTTTNVASTELRLSAGDQPTVQVARFDQTFCARRRYATAKLPGTFECHLCCTLLFVDCDWSSGRTHTGVHLVMLLRELYSDRHGIVVTLSSMADSGNSFNYEYQCINIASATG